MMFRIQPAMLKLAAAAWLLGATGAMAADTTLEFTQWSTIGDLTNRRYYVKTYDDQTLRSIDLMSFDLDAKKVVSAALKPAINPPALEFGK